MSTSTSTAADAPDIDISGLSISPSKKEVKTSELIQALIQLSRKSPSLVKATGHDVKSSTTSKTRRIWSWKMSEFKYSVQPSPFPTLARGLFTEWIPANSKDRSDGDDEVKGGKLNSEGFHRVVARGYDKFFNMNEVRWNTWEAVEANTTAPYYLTLKSNGCIIFIASLSPSEVVVMSKHSLGALEGREHSHAQMGEKWLDRHLASSGKTKEELAKRLWDENATAVAELCDDSFEEHVLPYSKESTGLHLHGINLNQGTFETFSPEDVQAFAKEWGFIPTPIITLQTCKEVKDFTDEIEKSGKWEGQTVEGFVVRTKVAHTDSANSPPYPPGSDYFFKIKFDEPYMTYRDWREITRTILAARKKVSLANVPKSKLRRPESFVYRDWVSKEIVRDPAAFVGFADGKGIIAIRERFLEWLETEEGNVALELQKNLGKRPSGVKQTTLTSSGAQEKWERAVIVPVAVPGCGKTVIGLALARLFEFGHTQSDDVVAKQTGPAFEKNIAELFKKHKVVYADRNNHLSKHRQGIQKATAKLKKGPPIKVLALNWAFTLPNATIARICSDRIQGRGENHQSLRGDDSKSYESVIWKFIDDSQELKPREADEVIEMNVEDTPEEAVSRVIDRLVPLLGLERPTDEAIEGACQEAMKYQPALRKDARSSDASGSIRYFGLLAELDVEEVVSGALEIASENDGDVPEAISTLWGLLVEKKRVTRRPHITIVHNKGLPEAQALWDRCQALQKPRISPVFEFRLTHLVTDGDVMALTVEDLTAIVGDQARATDGGGERFLKGLPGDLVNRLHITVGTKNDFIAAATAGSLVEEWKGAASDGKFSSIPLPPLKGQGCIKPVFN